MLHLWGAAIFILFGGSHLRADNKYFKRVGEWFFYEWPLPDHRGPVSQYQKEYGLYRRQKRSTEEMQIC